MRKIILGVGWAICQTDIVPRRHKLYTSIVIWCFKRYGLWPVPVKWDLR